MPKAGDPPRPDPAGPDLLRRMAELESEEAELGAELRERIRDSQELCRQARAVRLEWQNYCRELEKSLARP